MKDPRTTMALPVHKVEHLRSKVTSLEEAEARHQRMYAELLASCEQYRSILEAAPS
jgi:hypothetical protein